MILSPLAPRPQGPGHGPPDARQHEILRAMGTLATHHRGAPSLTHVEHVAMYGSAPAAPPSLLTSGGGATVPRWPLPGRVTASALPRGSGARTGPPRPLGRPSPSTA